MTTIDTNLPLIKLTPNMSPQTLASLIGSSAAVLEGTGVGHIRTELQPVVVQFAKPVVISAQAVLAESNLAITTLIAVSWRCQISSRG